MRRLNPLEILTVRTGKLVVDHLYDPTKHPCDWDWYDKKRAFGIGKRGFVTKQKVQNSNTPDITTEIFMEFRLTGYKIFDLDLKKRPRKIRGELYQSHYKEERKHGLRWVDTNFSVDLNNIYRLYFEDEISKKRFAVINIDILDFFQPDDFINGFTCSAYFDFNPYAVNGTGFKDWSHPYMVDVLSDGYEEDLSYKTGDLFDSMERSILYKDEHIKDLSNYTSLKF